MNNNNVFIRVGVDYHNADIPIISDGKYFFALGDYINGIYTMCCEVSDKNGSSKDNDSHFEDFKYFYDENGKVAYRMINRELE